MKRDHELAKENNRMEMIKILRYTMLSGKSGLDLR